MPPQAANPTFAKQKPQAHNIYDVERWGYDPGSKFWTWLFGIVIAAIIDYVSVAMPVRRHPRVDPYMHWWTLGLGVAMLAPASWLIGRATKKDWNGVVIWATYTVAAVVFQLVVIVWARSAYK